MKKRGKIYSKGKPGLKMRRGIFRRIASAFLLIAFMALLLPGCGLTDDENADAVLISENELSGAVDEESSVSEAVNENDLTSASTEEDAEEQPTEISLIMVGDILLHTPLQESGLMEDGTYNYDHFFTYTKDLISGADIAIVNQEVILGGTELGLSGYPSFNGAYEVGDALVDAGFDVICHATNHALDKGSTGLLNCISFWQENYPDIAVLGIHDSKESQDDNIYYYEQDGIVIAFLNYTYGTNGIELPQSYMVDLLEEDAVIEDLKEANANADFVVVCPHWGTEYTHSVSSEQEYWTKIFLENGVDLVIGTHPHVIQPVEWVEDDEGNSMLIYYSLGNFINFTSDTGEGTAKRAVGAMADVTLTIEDGEVYISDYGVVPLVSHMVEGTGNPTVYPLSEYTEELAEENAMSEKDPAFSLEYCRDLCSEIFGDLY